MAVEEDVNPSPSVYKQLPHVDNLDNLDSKIKKIVSRLNISEEEKNIIIKKIKEKIRKWEINPKIFYDPDGIDAEKLAFVMELKDSKAMEVNSASSQTRKRPFIDTREQYIKSQVKRFEDFLRVKIGDDEEKIRAAKERYEKALREKYNKPVMIMPAKPIRPTYDTKSVESISKIKTEEFKKRNINTTQSIQKRMNYARQLNEKIGKIVKILKEKFDLTEAQVEEIVNELHKRLEKGQIKLSDLDGIDAEKLAFAMELKWWIKDNWETATPAWGWYTSVDWSPQEEKHIQNKLKLMEEALRKKFWNDEEKIQKFKEKYKKILKERHNSKRVPVTESGKYKKPMEWLNSQEIKNKEVKRSKSGLFTRVERIWNKFERILNVKLSRIPDTNKKVALLEKIEWKLTKKLQKIEWIKETNPRKYELYKQVINKLLSIITEKKNELTQESVLIKEDDFIESLF